MSDKLNCLNTEESLALLNGEDRATVSELLERSKLYFKPTPAESVPMRDIGAVADELTKTMDRLGGVETFNRGAVTESAKSVTGLKYDGGKPKISLIPIEAINEMATSFTYGANKYSADNYKNGLAFRRLLDASLRHILAIANGEDKDEESGLSHLGNALASLAMLAYMMKNKPEFDDRYKGGAENIEKVNK
jgi:hypothetical protein